MKNFFLYYNKNNHLISKYLTFNAVDNRWESELIDEPFFVVGLYLDSKKYTSSDLTPHEQVFCISDYNNLQNVQPNYFRDAHSPLLFAVENLQSVSSLSSDDNSDGLPFSVCCLKFSFPTIVESDSIYNQGQNVSFRIYLNDGTFSLADNGGQHLLMSNKEVAVNKFAFYIAGLFLYLDEKIDATIDVKYYPQTNALVLSPPPVGYEVENYVDGYSGLPYIHVVNTDLEVSANIFISDKPIKESDL